MIRVFEAFAGYGSQAMALNRLGIDVEYIGISEIDKHAIAAYNAVHGEIHNFGDITKIDWDTVPDFDLFTYSFPCQSISSAGLQNGFEEGSGTNSSLLWECKRAIDIKRPKYLLMENVEAITHKKFITTFNLWQSFLTELGYINFTQVLNAKDYGLPQNRKRAFMVSILSDDAWYDFPPPKPLNTYLKDILEQNVSELYYNKPCVRWIQSDKGRECINKGWAKIDGETSQCLTYRGYPSWNYQYVTDNKGLRIITELEALRLMGLYDDDANKIINTVGEQSYCLAGNSIPINVLEEIFRQMFNPAKINKTLFSKLL